MSTFARPVNGQVTRKYRIMNILVNATVTSSLKGFEKSARGFFITYKATDCAEMRKPYTNGTLLM